MTHVAVPIKVNAWVDKGVASLVEALNSSPHVFTVDSCEDRGNGIASVYFRYLGSPDESMKFYFWLGKEVADKGAVTLQLQWKDGDTEPMAELQTERAAVDAAARLVRELVSTV